jgi:hypothetical protein
MKKQAIPVPRALYEATFPDNDPRGPEPPPPDDYPAAPGNEPAVAFPQKTRFTLIHLDDIELGDEPAYLIDGILPAGPSFGETPAPPKSLKSFFVMDMLLHVAIGKPYAGRRVQQGAVVYVTSEGIRGVKRRLIAMRRHHGVEGKQVPFFLVPVMPNLGTGTDDLNQLISAINAVVKDITVPVRAVAVDTLRKATPGKSENDSKDMSVLLSNCDTLASTFECHVNAVHHSPRSDDKRGSGTNAIEGSCDVILPVTRCDSGDGTPRATVTIGRMKDGEEGDTWSFELRSMEIGKDRNKTPIFAAYVVVTDEPAKQPERPENDKPQRMPKAAQTALRALSEALSECGEKAPTSNHIPPGVRVTTLERWRTYAYQRGISASEKPRARQAAFQRASEYLVGAQEAAIWGEHVWRSH